MHYPPQKTEVFVHMHAEKGAVLQIIPNSDSIAGSETHWNSKGEQTRKPPNYSFLMERLSSPLP